MVHAVYSKANRRFVTFCFITLLFMLPSMTVVREKSDIAIIKRSLKEETKTAIANRTFVGWTLAVGFLSFAFIALTQQMVGFIQEVLLLNTIEALMPMNPT